jgi:hypothetical protein
MPSITGTRLNSSGSSTGLGIELFVASHLKHLFANETYPMSVHLVEEAKFATLVPPQRR